MLGIHEARTNGMIDALRVALRCPQARYVGKWMAGTWARTCRCGGKRTSLSVVCYVQYADQLRFDSDKGRFLTY